MARPGKADEVCNEGGDRDRKAAARLTPLPPEVPVPPASALLSSSLPPPVLFLQKSSLPSLSSHYMCVCGGKAERASLPRACR